MGWQDLLKEKEPKTIIAPWVGGREIRVGQRLWRITWTPDEHGWYRWSNDGKTCQPQCAVEADFNVFPHSGEWAMRGYLAGDRLVHDNITVALDPANIIEASERVFLLEPMDRFTRVRAGRMHEHGELIFMGLEFPLGPEAEVQRAFEDGATSLPYGLKGVTPSLDAAFRMEVYQRQEAQRRREELVRIREAERAEREREQRRRELVERLGDAEGRRAMARAGDFQEAARAALAVGGAVYLDHRHAVRRGEMAVRFRFLNRRFECTCDAETLTIIDSGICLTAHDRRQGFAAGTKGDTWFTLESLPSVIKEADDGGKLVVYRHVD